MQEEEEVRFHRFFSVFFRMISCGASTSFFDRRRCVRNPKKYPRDFYFRLYSLYTHREELKNNILMVFIFSSPTSSRTESRKTVKNFCINFSSSHWLGSFIHAGDDVDRRGVKSEQNLMRKHEG